MSASLTVSAGKSIHVQTSAGAYAPATGNGVAPSSGSGTTDRIEGTSGRGRTLQPTGATGTSLPGPASGSGLRLRKGC